MLKTDKQYTIVMLEDSNEKDYIYYGNPKIINHFLVNSDLSNFTIIEIKYFNNANDFQKMLDITKNDFTNCNFLDDVIFYDFYSYDGQEKSNNVIINPSEKMVTLYDYNKEIYKVLHDEFHAINKVERCIFKDDQGQYCYTKGLNLFNPEKFFPTKKDIKQYHKKSYLQIKYNEMIKDKNNWIIKEIITEKEYSNRCNFLDRLSSERL